MSVESSSDQLNESAPLKRKRGRPKGSKTKVLPVVVETPPGCPSCGSTEYKVLAVPRQMDTRSVVWGLECDRTTWRRCQCLACGQIYMRRTHRLLNNAFDSKKMVTYFIATSDMKYVKIGRTLDLSQRVAGLQGSHPEPLIILHVTKSEESDMHERFSSLRKNGEWFEMDEEIYRFIETDKKYVG